tara:strand:+ start:690 stop:959 length:270 start_codon:yes stop_codon:yes gene_type:complete
MKNSSPKYTTDMYYSPKHKDHTMITNYANGPIQEYLDLTDETLSSFKEKVKAGDPVALQLLAANCMHSQLVVIEERIDALTSIVVNNIK